MHVLDSVSWTLPCIVSSRAGPAAILERPAKYAFALSVRSIGRPVALLVLAGASPDTHRQTLLLLLLVSVLALLLLLTPLLSML